ncbi:craniofacial development protein 1 [Nilaparvata lugens]|uniref:craniofacial development protein 1 n=1 Tax=Nilaparvata lugens TaxID=108931 RepID=UPI000B985A3B|nr:craniofacial development protein 1 [Nilaparvata lugens]
MNEQDLPSDSDESDLEYKPSDEEHCEVSEEDESGDDEDKNAAQDEEIESETNNKKKVARKPGAKRKSRKRKIVEESSEKNESPEEPEEKKLSVEEEKKKADALWEDFLKDTGGRIASSSRTQSSNIPDIKSNETTNGTIGSSKTLQTNEKENKVTVTQIFEFAGEKIKVEKEVPVAAGSGGSLGTGMRGTGRGRGGGRGGGMGGALSAFVGQLGKKNKLSMLEKSKLDWDSFKKEEGIEDDLKTFNKGKDGYLERQDFLQRADLRQFEKEKEMRAKRSGR